QDLALSAFERIGGNAVVLHEFVKGLARDAPEPGARDAESLQLAVVEATDDGLLTDFANFGGFASREDGFHALYHPSSGHQGPVEHVDLARNPSDKVGEIAFIHESRYAPSVGNRVSKFFSSLLWHAICYSLSSA